MNQNKNTNGVGCIALLEAKMCCDICGLEATPLNIALRGSFHRMDEGSWRCESCIKTTDKRKMVARQFIEAANNKVTCACSRTLPLRFAYRCLYCGQFYCQKCAEEHFGKTRKEYDSERASNSQLTDAQGGQQP